MVEVDDQEWMIIADYISNELPATYDLGNAPDAAKTKYTEVLQIMNSYGQADQSAGVDAGVAAPA